MIGRFAHDLGMPDRCNACLPTPRRSPRNAHSMLVRITSIASSAMLVASCRRAGVGAGPSVDGWWFTNLGNNFFRQMQARSMDVNAGLGNY